MADLKGLVGLGGDALINFASSCPKLRELVCDSEEEYPWEEEEGEEEAGPWASRTRQQLETIRGVIGPRARAWQLAHGLPESTAAAASLVSAPAPTHAEYAQRSSALQQGMASLAAGEGILAEAFAAVMSDIESDGASDGEGADAE